MKTLIVGDIHAKHKYILPLVDEALRSTGAGRVVFLGDYCDDWHISDGYMLHNLELFADWADYKRSKGLAVDVLCGNHDFCYLDNRPGPGTSYRLLESGEVRSLLLDRLDVRAATVVGGCLCTHAGLTKTWSQRYFGPETPKSAEDAAAALNAMLRDERAGYFWRISRHRGGRHESSSPIWADMTELLSDAADGFDQIVGHTPSDTVKILRGSAGQSLVFADTMSIESNYHPIGDGSFVLVNNGGANDAGVDGAGVDGEGSFALANDESVNDAGVNDKGGLSVFGLDPEHFARFVRAVCDYSLESYARRRD